MSTRGRSVLRPLISLYNMGMWVLRGEMVANLGKGIFEKGLDGTKYF
jgi:hypothetical protein